MASKPDNGQPDRPSASTDITKTVSFSKQGRESLVKPSASLSLEPLKKFGPCEVEAHQAQTAILLLPSPEVHVVLEALNCLQRFCRKSDDNKRLFIAMGGLQETRKLIFSVNIVVQRLALKVMAVASTLHEAAIQLRDLDVATELITLANSEDNVVAEYATFILSNLGMLFSGRLQIIHNEGLATLLRLLSHADPDVQKNSAETIWKILEEPMNVQLITTKEFLESLVKLIDSKYSMLLALSILEKVASWPPASDILEQIDAMSTLAEKLSQPDCSDSHRTILRTLANMAMNSKIRLKLAPTVPAIVRVLEESKDPIVRVHALEALGMLSMLPVVSIGLVDNGMCKVLLNLLADEKTSLEIKEAAAYCVSQMMQSDYRARGELSDAISHLLKLSQAEGLTEPGFEYIMMAFASILTDRQKGCPAFVNLGGLCAFHKTLQNHESFSRDTILSLLSCIGIIASNKSLREFCVDEGIIPALLQTVEVKNDAQFLIACATAICGLLCSEKGRKQFLENNGCKFLIKLLSHTEFPVVAAAAPLLLVLGSYADSINSLLENGILQILWGRTDLVSKSGPLGTTFETLVSTCLPLKYAATGRIGPYEKLEDGFYDVGFLKSGQSFPTLTQTTWEDRDPYLKIVYLNWLGLPPAPAALENNETLKVMLDEGQNCLPLLEMVKSKSTTVQSEQELMRLIATTLSNKFGGIMDKWRVGAHSEELEVTEVQVKFKSVVVPISMIKIGGFRIRAILFKAMCDCFGIPCSLERGDYGRVWNVVLVESTNDGDEPTVMGTRCSCTAKNTNMTDNPAFKERLQPFVVDLVYQPGTLLPLDSYDANTYCYYS